MSVECPQCGETFGTERAKNIHRGKSHDKDTGKPWMHEEQFRRLWVD